jgi:hypothetical protein
MTSRKLTKEMRLRIERTILNKAATKRQEIMKEESDKLAREVVAARCGADVWKKVARIPKGWLSSPNNVSVYAPGVGHCYLYFKERTPTPRLGVDYQMDNGLQRADIPPDLLDKVIDFHNRERGMQAELRVLEAQVRGTLGSIATLEKLKETWPEAYKALPAEQLSAPPNMLPAVRVEKLNEMLETFAKAGLLQTDNPATKARRARTTTVVNIGE